MSNTLQSNKSAQGKNEEHGTAYGGIGVAIFIIVAGFSYLIPNILPEGSLYIVAGVLFLLVNILNAFKGIRYDLFYIILGLAFLITGINKVLALELKFLPVIFIALGFVALITNLKRLKD